MKKLLLTIFIVLICTNINIFPKWTVIKFYGYEDEYNEQGEYRRGYDCMLLFDGNEGYVARKDRSDLKMKFLKTTDRGDTWHYLDVIIDSITWRKPDGEWYFNACYFDQTNCSYITDNYFYILFPDLSNTDEISVYMLTDSTFTRNAVVLRYDRKTDDYELIETNITDSGPSYCTFLQMFDDKTGFYLSRFGLYKTTDSCKTWTKLYDLPYVETEMVAFWGLSAPTEQDIYLVSVGANFVPKRQFHYTHDGGATWTSKYVYGMDKVLFDSTGLGYILGEHIYYNEDGKSDYIKYTIAKTTDDCETMDTILTRNILEYIEGGICQNKSLGIILADFAEPLLTAVSWNNGKDWEWLDSVRTVNSYKYRAIVDSTRLYFDSPGHARWYIYDRETNSVIESPRQKKYDCLLYPNPLSNNEVLNINFHTGKSNQAIKCSISDITGKVLDEYSDNIFGTQAQIRYELDERFSVGTYFIVIEVDGEIIAREKFIVE